MSTAPAKHLVGDTEENERDTDVFVCAFGAKPINGPDVNQDEKLASE